MDEKRVLVTGATGFVGRPVVDALLARGYNVHALGRAVGSLPEQVSAHAVDLFDFDAVSEVVQVIRPTHMVHLAWYVAPNEFWTARANLDWVAASLMLYRAFAASGGHRLLVAGSCAEYEWTPNELDEAKTVLRPATLYGAAKDALHRLLAAAAPLDGISLAWGRLFFLYGPHERSNRLVADVARALLRGECARCGSGLPERDFMHVADAGAALAATLDSAHEGAVNIASGQCVPICQVLEAIADVTGRPDLIALGARLPPATEPSRLAANTEILNYVIGFRPHFGLKDGLIQTLAWWENELRAG